MEKEDIKVKYLNRTKTKTSKSKTRMILVILFLAVFLGISYIQIRGSYLEYLELGEKYLNVFYTNTIYHYGIMALNFVVLYIIMYFTNKGIKKGLIPFFEKEKKKIPKLPNKSLALVISAVVSFVVSSLFTQKVMLSINGTSFAVQDPIFGLDISYYVFQKPLIEAVVFYFLTIIVGLSIYMALYYVIVFNRYFDGVDGKMLRNSLFMKKLTRNILYIIIGIAGLVILNTQNTMFGKILTINEDFDMVGAGRLETTLKIWGYILFAIVIVIFAYRALKGFEKGDTHKVLKNLAVIPMYLVALFIVMTAFDILYVNSNELDKEKEFIAENIENTKNAYGLNIEEANIESTGTIKNNEIAENKEIIDNIPIITETTVAKDLKDNQTMTGHYVYPNISLAKYKVNDKEKLVYLAPREIINTGRTYNNKTYEYTHGMGEVIVSATESTNTGNVNYIQKELDGNDEKIKISEPRMYFGLETKEVIATNVKNKKEYDYTDENGKEYVSNYKGKAGLQLGFLDRIILGLSKGNAKLAFAGDINKDSKILINREVTSRARKALPYLLYDENPYTVINKDGRILWVLDGYTISSSYPYSQYAQIEYKGTKQKINYIRNSVKVIIDSYDGTMSFYITDRNDPIAMAYRNIYPDLFMDLDKEIPQDISEHFVYPKFLYEVQQEILKLYHNVKPDVLYRADDIWDIAKYNTSKSTKSSGIYMKPYYTMVKTQKGNELGLLQVYTPNEKQNIIAYLVGTNDNGTNKLKLYKFPSDNNVLGPMQLDKQIEEDAAISKEIDSLNVTGTKITKQMIIVPIDNTLLYVEPIYQTMLNESQVPLLKKVVVASGNKVAIGDNIEKALENLLSTYAVDIEVENTDDVVGLIDAIIKANKNLTDSNKNNNWEMMGKDINKLQTLITKLEEVKEIEDKKRESLEKEIKNKIDHEENIENKINTEIEVKTDEQVETKETAK